MYYSIEEIVLLMENCKVTIRIKFVVVMPIEYIFSSKQGGGGIEIWNIYYG